MVENKTNAEYLHEIYQELLADEEWELPPELRFFLLGKTDWDLLYL